jgi:dCMP deaminase
MSFKRKDYISWDEFFMASALLASQRSKDPSTQVGACIVNPKNNKILGEGYNGLPIGISGDDEDITWKRDGEILNTKYLYVCHAELNAIMNKTADVAGCTVYVTLFPCNNCAQILIQSGIKQVVYLHDKYAETDCVKASKKMFDKTGVSYTKFIPQRKEIVLNFA